MPTPKKKPAPAKYAAGTTVPVARSRDEIEKLLKKHQATSFLYGAQDDRAIIAFEMRGRQYRMEVYYPAFATFRSSQRTAVQQQAAYETEQRRRWRSLALVIKAKLEAAASEITTIEEEFLAHVVMPNKQTVSQWLDPQIQQIYESGRMPALLPEFAGARDEDIPDLYIEGKRED